MAKGLEVQHTILLVEDDDNDVFFFRRCLSALAANVQVHVVPTAWDARNYIEGLGKFRDREYYPLPELFVLDMHLPGASGIQLLEWLRQYPTTCDKPIFFLCGSMWAAESAEITAATANGHYVKTPDFARAKENVAQMLKALRP